MEEQQHTIVITDSSVLINFLAVDRMDLLANLKMLFVITDHVYQEITDSYIEKFERFKKSIQMGIIQQISVDQPDELELFAKLNASNRLGEGECSAIAVSLHRGYLLAIDDKIAIREALTINPSLKILKTQDIIVECILAGLLDVTTADLIKEEWACKHNYKLKFSSFSELVTRPYRQNIFDEVVPVLTN
jgi:predicted nucleic acid-binding protein